MPEDDMPPDRARRGLVVPIIVAVAVLVLVILHLTGVLGPGSH